MFSLSHHPDRHDVSFQEANALAGWLKNSNTALSNSNFTFCTHFSVDAALLARSLELACPMHDALFTRFECNSEGVLQRNFIPKTQQLFALQTIICGVSVDDPDVRNQVITFCNEPFFVASPQWLRVLLIYTADHCSVLVFRMPHVICDAVSTSILVADVWKRYEASAMGQTVHIAQPPYSLQDYAASQQRWLASADFEQKFNQMLSYTTAQTEGLLARLPTQPKPRLSRPLVGVDAFLSPAIQQKLEALANTTKIKLSTLLLACSMVCIARLYGQREFCLRLPFSARLSHQFERIIGFLSTDLPMLVHLDMQQTFLQFIAHIQRESLSMMRYGVLPWSLWRERLGSQISDALFNDYVINIIPGQLRFSKQAEFETHPFPIPVFGSSNAILKVVITQHAKGTRIALRAGEEERDRLQTQLLPEFMNTLCALIDGPERTLREILTGNPTL